MVGMNLSARLGRAAIAAFILGCTSIGAGSAFAAETTTVAQGTGTATLTEKVTDDAGVLSTQEKALRTKGRTPQSMYSPSMTAKWACRLVRSGLKASSTRCMTPLMTS